MISIICRESNRWRKNLQEFTIIKKCIVNQQQSSKTKFRSRENNTRKILLLNCHLIYLH